MKTTKNTVSVYALIKENLKINSILGALLECFGGSPCWITRFKGSIEEVAEEAYRAIKYVHGEYPTPMEVMIVTDSVAQVIFLSDPINGPANIEDSLRWICKYGKIDLDVTDEARDYVSRFASNYGYRLSDEQLESLVRSLIFNETNKPYLEKKIESFTDNLKKCVSFDISVHVDAKGLFAVWSINYDRFTKEGLHTTNLNEVINSC